MNSFFCTVEEARALEPLIDQGSMEEVNQESKPRDDLETFLHKSPISVISEYSATNYRTQPQFNTISETFDKVPEFQVSCSLYRITTIGKGTSKKQARHRAALSYLHEVVKKGIHKDFNVPGATPEEAHKNIDMMADPFEYTNKAAEPAEKEVLSGDAVTFLQPEDAVRNWVGYLQEMCQKDKIPNPIYDSLEEGPPNDRIFITKCTIAKAEATGRARSKKLSKTFAAYGMTQLLEKGKGTFDAEPDLSNEDEIINTDEQRCREVEELEIREQDHIAALKQYLSDRTKFEPFQDSDLKFNISEDTVKDDYAQCILEVSVDILVSDLDSEEKKSENAPAAKDFKRDRDNKPFSYGGAGKDAEKAKQNAAKKALIHLRTYF